MPVASTLAYYDPATITAVVSLIGQALSATVGQWAEQSLIDPKFKGLNAGMW